MVNARAAGPRLGKNVQLAIKGSKSGDWSVSDAGVVTAGGLELEPQEYTLETVVAESEGGSQDRSLPQYCPAAASWSSTPRSRPSSRPKGMARDMVRAIQQARKDAGLKVSDRIRTIDHRAAELVDALQAQRRAGDDRNADAWNWCSRSNRTLTPSCRSLSKK